MIEQLYKKKIIRDFLSLFIENKWKSLIASTLEYGIINLKKNYNVASLTADDILNLIEDVKKTECKTKEEIFVETRVLSCKSKTEKTNYKSSSKDKKITKNLILSKRSETPVKTSNYLSF